MQNNRGRGTQEPPQAIRQTRVQQQYPPLQERPPVPAPRPAQTAPRPAQATAHPAQTAPCPAQATAHPAQATAHPAQNPLSDGAQAAQLAQELKALPPPSSRSQRGDTRRPLPASSAVIPHPPARSRSGKAARKAEGSRPQKKRGFYLQPLREISWPRRIIMLGSGLLFLWCLAPVFFAIRGVGVIASSAVMLAVFLGALLWHLIDEHRSPRAVLTYTCIGLVFSVCTVAFCVVSGFMLKASMTVAPYDGTPCTLVVLGCKVSGSQPSWMLEDRLNRAYSELTEHPDLVCVVTGGKGDDEAFAEAVVMKKYLTDKGIAPDRIYTEEASTNTQENLLYNRAVIELNGLSPDIVIVTDRFHELRARIWAENAGFSGIYAASCETRPYLVIGYWFREMFGLARLMVFGE